MQQAFAKSHKSALCIIPPLAAQAAVQRVRCFQDKSFIRWPPHVNLLYPFRSGDEHEGGAPGGSSVLEDAAHAATRALAHVQPFKVRFDELAFFAHGPRSFTLWLKAADDSGLVALQAALQAAFPECTDLGDDPARGIARFTPHLSLGQWQDKHALLAAMQAYSSQGNLLGVEFEVNEVCILSRQGYRDPFSIAWAVPLASATPSAAAYTQPQRLGVPYIAAVNPAAAASAPTAGSAAAPPAGPTARARFGLGAAPQGLFNFSFGANMAPSKLGGARGLHPVRSQPATLSGHRLAFNHRGGFGNLVAGSSACQDSTAAAAAPAPAPAAPDAVHGVLHELTPAELGELMCMEHEYQPVVVWTQPYRSDGGDGASSSSSEQQAASAGPDEPEPALVPAVAFISPPERCIAEGLPPTQRYLGLLIEGARHWQLDASYRAWLEAQPALADGDKRGDAYYTSPDGQQQLSAWPKIRTGGQQGGRGRGGGRGGGGKQHRPAQQARVYQVLLSEHSH